MKVGLKIVHLDVFHAINCLNQYLLDFAIFSAQMITCACSSESDELLIIIPIHSFTPSKALQKASTWELYCYIDSDSIMFFEEKRTY